jgi:putative transposase
MDTITIEQALRREAIRRRLQGERRCDICRDLGYTCRWFDKWWAEYQRDPHTDFSDHSRAPRTSPQAMPAPVTQAVVAVRRVLEAAATPETRYGLIGASTIQGRLAELHLRPLPSVPTIQRILQEQSLTHPVGAGQATAYYPWPLAWDVNVIHATDIITRHVFGGAAIENFHTIDHYSHAVWLTQHADQTSSTTRAHLLKTWAQLGLPRLHQFDNAGAFCGGHTHPRIIGQVVRLCLFCGIEPWFTPVYEAKRNYQIETFHSLWVKSFWTRYRFRDLAHVQREISLFRHWYHYHYRPPTLDGLTPAQVRRNVPIICLTNELQHLISLGRLPITAGRLHIVRRVNSAGYINLLNETWLVGNKWVGEYVRATINTTEQRLTIWHQPDADSQWRLLKTRQFRTSETIHDLLPAFRRNCERCREQWPD